MTLAATAALLSVNIFTGCPLLALWIGSKVQASYGSPSMTAVFAVIFALAALVGLCAVALTRVSASYDDLIDRPPAARRTSPWLRSMRGEREDLVDRRANLSIMDRILVASVVVATTASEIWFFFFSGSSIGQG